MNHTNINIILEEAASLKQQIEILTNKLDICHKAIDTHAIFKEKSKTGYIYGEKYVFKVVRRNNIKWDQEKLSEAREVLGEELFFSLCDWTFKPKAKEIEAFLAYHSSKFKDVIEKAKTENVGKPSISFEVIESC